MEKKYKNPLKKRIFIGCFTFVFIICAAMGAVTFSVFRSRMMEQYRSHLIDIINLTMTQIDIEDLKNTIDTGEKSEKFIELEDFFDQARRHYSLDYITLTRPIKEGDSYDVISIMSGLLPEEREGQRQRKIAIPQFGDRIGQFLDPAAIPVYYEELNTKHEIYFSTDNNDFGRNYVAGISLFTEKGEPVALMTASLSLSFIDNTMRRYIITVIIVTILLTAVIQYLMMRWFQKRILTPLSAIESAARKFDETSSEVGNPDALVLNLPVLNSADELESLSDTLSSMSHKMKTYVENMLESATKLKNLEQDLENSKEKAIQLSELATKDALTGIRNKTAYDKEVEKVVAALKEGDKKFGIVMVDLNFLKKINDEYGHDKGNISIKALCHLVCVIYAHSPVFRIGGDEFVAILRGSDYDSHEELASMFNFAIEETSNNADAKPWERISAALGYALYDETLDANYESVFKRADEAMYQRKREMKAERTS